MYFPIAEAQKSRGKKKKKEDTLAGQSFFGSSTWALVTPAVQCSYTSSVLKMQPVSADGGSRHAVRSFHNLWHDDMYKKCGLDLTSIILF